MWKRKLYAFAVIALALGMVAVVCSGCRGAEKEYDQSVKITVEPMSQNGVLLMMEYYRDSELTTSMRLIDGDGDGVIDGKSGPTEKGQWPKGWGWFDDLYEEVTVGQTTMSESGGKVAIQDEATSHELRAGEYQVGKGGTGTE